MSIEVVLAIIAVALVLLALSAFPSTRYILWESVLHPFKADESAHDQRIAHDPAGREVRDVKSSRPKQEPNEELKDDRHLVAR